MGLYSRGRIYGGLIFGIIIGSNTWVRIFGGGGL